MQQLALKKKEKKEKSPNLFFILFNRYTLYMGHSVSALSRFPQEVVKRLHWWDNAVLFPLYHVSSREIQIHKSIWFVGHLI